ncbi:sensor domain-containing diguanylate cyclase [Aliivibrio fischeri]|uniref:sensor domain-containing diguanylate cyclase n=1 Tax=Aliivibrio fischeri TaxID=668 RepID=UPI0012DAB610|nr:diguanylate cyclase [Aliivibrio fischeri]MUJ36723.1 diguanylate cyclase [Aliivibrio fischeri]
MMVFLNNYFNDRLYKIIIRSLSLSILLFFLFLTVVSNKVVKEQYSQFYLFMSKVEEYKQNILLLGLLANKNIENYLLKNEKIELIVKNDNKFGVYSIVQNDKLTMDEIIIINMALEVFGYVPYFLQQRDSFLFYRSYSGSKYLTSRKINDLKVNESMFKYEYCNIHDSCTLFNSASDLEDRVVISNVYIDAIKNEEIITVSSPVFKNEEIIGDFNFDIYLREFSFLKNKKITEEVENVYKIINIKDSRYPFYDFALIREYYIDNRTMVKYKLPISRLILEHIFVLFLIYFLSLLVVWKLMLLSDKKNKLLKAELIINKDELTGIYNRSILNDNKFISIKRTKNMAILAIDGDKIKEINDTYGHDTGDEAIKCIANGMKATFRDDDFLIRTGGDEFLALLPGCSLKVAEELSNVLKENIKLNSFNKHGIKIEVSVGLSMFEINGNLKDSIKKADIMLYKDKNS